jgi:hypothetical protein
MKAEVECARAAGKESDGKIRQLEMELKESRRKV